MRRGEGQALDGAARRDGCARHRRGLFFRRALCRLPGGDGAALAHRCGGAGAAACERPDLRQARRAGAAGCVRDGGRGARDPVGIFLHAAAAHAPARGGDGAHAARGGVLQRLGCALHGHGLRQAQDGPARQSPQDGGGRARRHRGRCRGHGDLPDRVLFLHACAAAHRLVRGHRPCRRADGRAGRSELFRHQAAGRHQGLRPPAAGARRRARPV